MESLYEIANEYLEILNYCESEDAESLSEKIEALQSKFDDKAKNIAYIIGTLKNDCKTIKEEIERLSVRLERKNKNLLKLQEYLKGQMIIVGKPKVETPTHTLYIKNTVKTEVDDEFIGWAIENKKRAYLEEKTSYKPIKKLIKEEIEKGNLDCDYARLVQSQSLIIK